MVTSQKSRFVRRAYTLVELLVAIAIIALLMALLLPAIQAAREASRRVACANNIRQLALGAINHEGAFRRYPPGYLGETPANINIQPATNSYVGHLVYLMPFLELDSIYNSWSSKRDLTVTARTVVPNDPRYMRWSNGSDSLWDEASYKISVFLCPSDDPFSNTMSTVTEMRTTPINAGMSGFMEPTELGRTNYLGSAGRLGVGLPSRDFFKGVFYNRSRTRNADILDGTTNTLLFGEVTGQFTDPIRGVGRLRSFAWTAGAQFTEWHRPIYRYGRQKRIEKFSSMHPTIMNFAYADGSVKALSQDVDGDLLVGLSSIAGSEIVAESEN